MRAKSPESVVGVLFNPQRTAVLLIQRRDVPVWVLPGGGLNTGELPHDAVAREMLEETGLTVKPDRLVGIYTPINRLTRKTKLYECTPIRGDLSLSNETKGISFFPIENLPAMPPPYREWIEDALKKGPILLKPLTSITYASFFRNFLRHPILVLRFLISRLGFPINS
ncbi:MAG TPA: NUDIX domain-containing protein [Chlamydiales bacterium]|nr:NUDIX domain-containing protein [Chlamydiales bacterium]